jgi:hypothetical protein
VGQIILKDFELYGGDENMCHFWFSTAFISESNLLVFEKSVIDKAAKVRRPRPQALAYRSIRKLTGVSSPCQDKHHRKFDKNFKVEVYLQRVAETLNLNDSRITGFESGKSSSEESAGTDDDA